MCYITLQLLCTKNQLTEAALHRCFQEKGFENMQQLYRRTPMPKCDFNKVALQRKVTLLKLHFGMGVLL